MPSTNYEVHYKVVEEGDGWEPIRQKVEETRNGFLRLRKEVITYGEIHDMISKNIAKRDKLAAMGKTKEAALLGREINQMNKMRQKGSEWVATSRKMTNETSKFRMALLGTMFFGMALSNTLGSMTKGAMDWLGISDMMQLSLNLIAMQGLLPMTDQIYAFLNGLLSMDQASAAFVGGLMVIGQGAGVVLSTVSMLINGIWALSNMFGPAMLLIAAPALALAVKSLGDVLSKSPGMEGMGTALSSMAAVIPGMAAGNAVKSALGGGEQGVETTLLPPSNVESWKLATGVAIGVMGLATLLMVDKTADTRSRIISETIGVLEMAFSGYLIGGPPGALIGFIIGAVIVMSIDPAAAKIMVQTALNLCANVGSAFGIGFLKLLEDNHLIPKGTAMAKYANDLSWQNKTTSDMADKIVTSVGAMMTAGIKSSVPVGKTAEQMAGWNPTPVADDFISRPGMGIQPFSPSDTVIGTKGGGGMGGNVTVNTTINASLHNEVDVAMLQRTLSENITRDIQSKLR